MYKTYRIKTAKKFVSVGRQNALQKRITWRKGTRAIGRYIPGIGWFLQRVNKSKNTVEEMWHVPKKSLRFL